MTSQHVIYILFLFALGTCVGSFLNVVVWRLPRAKHAPNESLFRALFVSARSITYPPSHCPKCQHALAWRDNLPVIGWILLGGKCRYCREPISIKYPIFEALTGLIFVFYYVAFFIIGWGPCAAATVNVAMDPFGRPIPLGMTLNVDWPIFLLFLFMLSSLLAASLIDAESYTIPLEIPWLMAVVGFIVHAFFDTPLLHGALNAQPVHSALAAGSAVGLIFSIFLLHKGVLKQSFADGAPPLEIDLKQNPELEPKPITRRELNAEMRKEILFLLPPLILGAVFSLLVLTVPSIALLWMQITAPHWVCGLLGSILGAMVGAFVVWFVRIAGSIGFGREAMGLGDVHLMFGVGAIVGAWTSTLAFFLAPFFGILIALNKLFTGKGRELPYGPFLALGTAAAILCTCDVANYLMPAVRQMAILIRSGH